MTASQGWRAVAYGLLRNMHLQLWRMQGDRASDRQIVAWVLETLWEHGTWSYWAWSSTAFTTQTSAVLCRHIWCLCENLDVLIHDNLEILIMKAISILLTFFTTLDSKSDFAFWKEQFLFMLQKIFQTPHILLCLSNALHHTTLLKGVQILH